MAGRTAEEIRKWEEYRAKDSEYYRLRLEFHDKIRALQERCEHKDTRWISARRWRDNRMVFEGEILRCHNCNKILDEKPKKK